MTTPTSTERPISPPAQQTTPLLAWILLFILALVWGSSFILIKRSLASFSPTQVATGRITFAFLFFLPYVMLKIRQFPRQQSWVLLASGVLGYLIPAFMFAIAGAHLSSSLAGALNSLSPLFTLVLGAIFFGNSLQTRQVIGVLLGFAGSVFLVFLSATGSFSVNGYALLLVVATLCYGLNINLVSRYLRHLPALTSTSWTFALTGPLALLGLLTTDFPVRAVNPASSSSFVMLIILGVLGSGLMTVLFNRIIQLSSAIFASSVTYLIPIVALGWGLLDGEPLYWPQIMGMAICLFGVYLINRK
ncbi:DMT family transporter [Tellurirhabdus bombi]|uniref:DMT family transporter n=1 Tax=Tellurirhabdus bombi TaxID=2907205 RepID=UPI001F2D71EC|nr:DMT family transporter [Tellurirhabdus bombi]